MYASTVDSRHSIWILVANSISLSETALPTYAIYEADGFGSIEGTRIIDRRWYN